MRRHTWSRPREDRFLGAVHLRARRCRRPPEARREAWNRFSLAASEGSSPAATRSQTSGLQSWEAIHFCEAVQLWCFVRAALGNNTTGKAANVDVVFVREGGPRET